MTRRSIALVGAAFLVACATARPDTRGTGIPPSAEDEGSAEHSATTVPWLKPREKMEQERQRARVDVGPAASRASSGIDEAVEQAAEASVGWWGDLPEQASYEELLSGDREFDGSMSIGTVSHGTVENAVGLDKEGSHHEIIERHRKRHTRWGTAEMIELLESAAQDVAEAYPGSTMRVGNIGWRHGGDIPWSSSHNSGRDADLAFYVRRDSDGERVPAPDLVSFDSEGLAIDEPGLRFDVPRNWELVKSLLTHPGTGIQWLFISKSLKEKLLAYARKNGEPLDLIEQAEKVLHQPTDAPPHNDHLHLRITCPKQDRLEGCLDYGPRWEWVDWHKRALLARSLELGRALEAKSPETRLQALHFLRRIRSPFAPEVALIEAGDDENPRVRREALDLATDIPTWSDAAVAAATRLIADESTSLDAKRELYSILRRSHTERARRFAFSRLLTEGVSPRERRLAAKALLHVMEPGLVPVLIEQLDEQPRIVRERIAQVLRRITGYSAGTDWRTAGPVARRKAQRSWSSWWEEHKHESRDRWLRASFQEHGFDASDVDDLTAVDDLIPLLEGTPDRIAYNANRLIHEATERWIPLEAWSYSRLHNYWRNWWRKNRERMLASRSDTAGSTTSNN